MDQNKEKKILRLQGWLHSSWIHFGELSLEDVRLLTTCICEDIEVPMPKLELDDTYEIARQLGDLELDLDKLAAAILMGVRASSHFSDDYKPCSRCHKMKKLHSQISLASKYCRKCKAEYNRSNNPYDSATGGRRRLTK